MNFCGRPPATRHPSAECLRYFSQQRSCSTSDYQMHYSAVNISCICISPLFPPSRFEVFFLLSGLPVLQGKLENLEVGHRGAAEMEADPAGSSGTPLVQFVPLPGRSSVASLRRPQQHADTCRPTRKRASSSSSSFCCC